MIILTAVIVGSLGSALMINFRALGVTGARFAASNDTQIASTYFSTDAASTWLGSKNLTLATPTPACADPGVLAEPGMTSAQVIGYSWQDSSDQSGAVTTETKNADWVVETFGASQTLVRLACVGGGPVTRLVMARHLDPSTPPNVLSVCAPTCTLVVTELTQATNNPPATYKFTLTGTPRINAPGGADVPVPPLLVLCTSGNCITGTDTCIDSVCQKKPVPAINNSGVSLDANDGSTLYVLNPDRTPASPVVNSTGSPAVTAVEGSRIGYLAQPWQAGAYAAGTVIFPAGSGNTHLYKLTAGGISGATEPLWTDNGVAVADGPLVWTDLGITSDGFQTVPVMTPNTTAATCYTDNQSTGLVNCPVGTNAPGIDPYAGAASPTQAGLTTYASQAQACVVSATGAATLCQPGVYNTPLVVSGNPNLAPGWKNKSYLLNAVILPTGNTPFSFSCYRPSHPEYPPLSGFRRRRKRRSRAQVDGRRQECRGWSVTWTDLGVPTTTLASGTYVLNQGLQLGRTGFHDNVVLSTDNNGVLLDFNGDAQMTENVAWATVTLNPLTGVSCPIWG